MKINTTFGDKYATVVAMYNTTEGKRYLYIPYRGYEGLIQIDESDITESDGDLYNFIEMITDNGTKMLVEREAVEEGLIYRMVDHDESSMNEYWRRVEAR